MIKNLIFDLDGTIINSYPYFVKFFYEVCKKNGVEVPYDRQTVYRMLKITVPQAYARLNCEEKMSYEQFYSDFVELYTQNYKKLTGFEETVSRFVKLKKQEKRITSTPTQVPWQRIFSKILVFSIALSLYSTLPIIFLQSLLPMRFCFWQSIADLNPKSAS